MNTSAVNDREICDILQINDEKASIVGLTSNDSAIHRMKSRHVELGLLFVSLVDMDLYEQRAISAFLEDRC